MSPQPEQTARAAIDALLTKAGWRVCDVCKLPRHVWHEKFGAFLQFNERDMLTNSGKVAKVGTLQKIRRPSLLQTRALRGVQQHRRRLASITSRFGDKLSTILEELNETLAA